MTIKAGGYQKFTVRTIRQFPGRIRGGKNSWPMVLLRPHGKSEGRVRRRLMWTDHKMQDQWWFNGNTYYFTRAQAAQAANKNFIDSWNRMIRNPEL